MPAERTPGDVRFARSRSHAGNKTGQETDSKSESEKPRSRCVPASARSSRAPASPEPTWYGELPLRPRQPVPFLEWHQNPLLPHHFRPPALVFPGGLCAQRRPPLGWELLRVRPPAAARPPGGAPCCPRVSRCLSSAHLLLRVEQQSQEVVHFISAISREETEAGRRNPHTHTHTL